MNEVRDYIEALYSEGKISELANFVNNLPEDQLLDVFALFHDELKIKLLRLLNPEKSMNLFLELDTSVQAYLLERFSPSEAVFYLDQLDPNQIVAILEELSPSLREQVLFGLDSKKKISVFQLLGYPENSIGRYINLDFLAFNSGISVDQALQGIRQSELAIEELEKIYIVDSDRTFLGAVTLPQLVKAPSDLKLAELVSQVDYLRVSDTIDKAVDLFSDSGESVLPVVDDNSRLVGTIRASDILELVEQKEAGKVARFGGTLTAEDIDYRTSSIWEIFKARALWLVILVIFGMVVADYIEDKSALLQKFIVLAAFIPPIVDMGGNSGSQSATMTIRALSLGQVPPTLWGMISLLKRDLLVATLLGLSLAVLKVGFSFAFHQDLSLRILLVIGLSMGVVVIVGSVIGVVLPFCATWLRLDPAVLSAPLLTSIMDTLGVVIFLGLAALILV